MNIFKKRLSVFFVLLYNLTILAVPADVSTYFLPDDSELFDSVLDTYFNDIAQKEVYVASYWLTDQKIIDKLIELKQRGVDVNVIFDITMPKPNFDQLFRALLSNKILPIFSPFGEESKMHNKFIIIDDEDVITGSANLTTKALGLGLRGNSNAENMVRIKSREIVAKYKRAFNQIKDLIFEYYLADVAHKCDEEWHSYYEHLFPFLFRDEQQFKDKVANYLKTKDRFQINQLFKLIPEARSLSSELFAGSSASVAFDPIRLPQLANPLKFKPLTKRYIPSAECLSEQSSESVSEVSEEASSDSSAESS
jgi:hypothetical protein